MLWLLSALLTVQAEAQRIGDSLPPWKVGYLDLHHISTGRGDAAFYIFPDGTSMLVDAGDMSESHPRITSPRNTPLVPDDSKTAGEWIADYIQQFHPKKKDAIIDYAMITHFHDDHMGEIDRTSKRSKFGDYRISGISEVGEHIPIRKMVDRGYPDYNFPHDMKSEEYQKRRLSGNDFYDSAAVWTMGEYWKFIENQKAKRKLVAEQFESGRGDQFILNYKKQAFPNFTIRNIHGNGIAWIGWKDETFSMVPQEILPGTDIPGENSLSLGVKISYGRFDYYTGGDIAGNNDIGEADFRSIEAFVAPVIGAVDVATLNHHGNRDSQSAYFVRTIRPKVWVQQVWSSDHPGEEVLRRISSKELYPGDRYIFSTGILEANKMVIGERIDRTYESSQGHVVIRVYEGGEKYQIFILDDQSKARKIVKVIGPIESR